MVGRHPAILPCALFCSGCPIYFIYAKEGNGGGDEELAD